jgi:hypothetical protein
MLVYSSGKTLGCAVMASANEPPSFTFCLMPARIIWNFLLSDCSDSAPMASASGIPACSKRRHLAREDGDVARLDPLEETLDVDLAAHALGAAAAGGQRLLDLLAAHHLAHFADEDALLAQGLAQRLGPVGFARARGRLARGVESFPGVDRHRVAPTRCLRW